MGIDLGRTDIGKELHAAPERSQGLHCGLLTAWVFFGAVGAGEGVFAGITHRAEQDAVAGTPQLIILRTQGIAVGLQTGDTADYIIIMERVPKFLCDPLQYLDTFPLTTSGPIPSPRRTAIFFSMAGTLPIFIRIYTICFVQFHYTKAYHVREIPKQKGYLRKSYGGLSLGHMPERKPGPRSKMLRGPGLRDVKTVCLLAV